MIDAGMVPDDMKRLAELLQNLEHLVRRIEAAQQGQEWFTAKETAGILKVSAYTVREYVKDGKLEATRDPNGAGGKGEWRISREAINRFREPKDSWPGDPDTGVPAKLIPKKPSGNGHAGSVC